MIERAGGLEGALDEQGELSSWAENDGAVFATLRLGDGRLIAHCSVHGQWLLDSAANRVVVAPGDGSIAGWEHRTLAMALPILCSERGDLVLHASAVEIGGRAFLFCGPPGAGKSSLCLALALGGHGLISEDGAVIDADAVAVWPGPTGVRLKVEPPSWAGRAEARTPVTLVDAPDCQTGPVPISGVVALGPRQGELAVEPLDGPEAVATLARHLMHRGEIAAFGDQFRLLARLCRRTAAWQVSMPDDLEGLPRAATELLDRLSHDRLG